MSDEMRGGLIALAAVMAFLAAAMAPYWVGWL